jgi:hypothetical protein
MAIWLVFVLQKFNIWNVNLFIHLLFTVFGKIQYTCNAYLAFLNFQIYSSGALSDLFYFKKFKSYSGWL